MNCLKWTGGDWNCITHFFMKLRLKSSSVPILSIVFVSMTEVKMILHSQQMFFSSVNCIWNVKPESLIIFLFTAEIFHWFSWWALRHCWKIRLSRCCVDGRAFPLVVLTGNGNRSPVNSGSGNRALVWKNNRCMFHELLGRTAKVEVKTKEYSGDSFVS